MRALACKASRANVGLGGCGGLRDALGATLGDKTIFRSPGALGPAYERPESVTDEDIETYLRPLVRTEQRTRDLQRFVVAFDSKHTRVIEARLRELRAPTLIVWGTDDVYFPVKWAHWLAETIPGAKPLVELEGVRFFFPEEREDEFNPLLRDYPAGNLRLLHHKLAMVRLNLVRDLRDSIES